MGVTFPSTGSAFWLKDDAYFVVMNGNVTFGTNVTHEYGDVFYVLAGTKVGPVINAGSRPVIVNVMTEADMEDLQTSDTPARNPSTSDWLSTRSYLGATSCKWGKNPSPHSDECIKNGGVYNCHFPAKNNTPPLLRVRWASNCQIPYHYHPTGAMYFIQYGHMLFKGDIAEYDETLNMGDVRWVRPGYDYGPGEWAASAAVQFLIQTQA
jgi:hypothetical protein